MEVKRPIIVRGDVAFVPLTQGKRAIIDSSDVSLVGDRNWYVLRHRKRLWYAVSKSKRHGRGVLHMHRIILPPTHGLEIDHVDHDGLNNRRDNLRVCTRSQNLANGRYTAISSSQFRGVSWHKGDSKWEAYISKDGKKMHLGTFDSEIEAAKAYDEAALKRHGDFASPNFVTTRAIVSSDRRPHSGGVSLCLAASDRRT